MIPPLTTLMENTAAVTAQLGTNPTRFFPSEYPENLSVSYPYSVYEVIGGVPANFLEGAPAVDNVRVQIDIYSDALSTAEAAYNAVRDATETVSHIVSLNFGGEYDGETKLYRYSFDISYWLNRS